jgi:hypothetical protein
MAVEIERKAKCHKPNDYPEALAGYKTGQLNELIN